jgi:hypothetical protein
VVLRGGTHQHLPHQRRRRRSRRLPVCGGRPGRGLVPQRCREVRFSGAGYISLLQQRCVAGYISHPAAVLCHISHQPLSRRYDPQHNRWTKVASMNTRRLGVAVAVLGGYLYAVGGSDGQCPLNTGDLHPSPLCLSCRQ